MTDNELNLRRFMTLFRGNHRSFGAFYPNKQKSQQIKTIKAEFTEDEFRSHLNGEVGIGIVPVRDDGSCFFGAIDVDNHGSEVDLDAPAIERRVRALQLPLVVCRSKSGGVHLYMFGSEPLKAAVVKQLLEKWMRDLQIEGSDCVFPKQPRLAIGADGNQALGNWINLPYFNADDTNRHAIIGGVPVTFDLFLTEAEDRSVTQSGLDSMFASEHSEAPPCIQAKIATGFGPGDRNVGAYQIAVYMRKKDPESAKAQAMDLVNRMCHEPLPYKELEKTIRSALRKDYQYKCHDEPFKSVCDRAACRLRKFGISEGEFEALASRDKMPTFSSLTKYLNTDPTRWEIKVNDVGILLTTTELFDFRVMRERVAEKLNQLLPRIKNDEWDKLLDGLMTTVSMVEAPSDASPSGVLRVRLEEFIRKADLTSDGDDMRDREAILRGMPVVSQFQGVRVVMFRSTDFANYLKNTRTDVVQNKDLWFRASRDLGIEHDRVKIRGRLVSVWYVPAPDPDEESHTPNLSPEF